MYLNDNHNDDVQEQWIVTNKPANIANNKFSNITTAPSWLHVEEAKESEMDREGGRKSEREIESNC